MHTTKKKISDHKTTFKAAIDTKKVDLMQGDASKKIRMKKSDQKVTSFITPFGTYCYVTMPFGLKNAGATYQRTMQRCLKDQIGQNVHAYVDNIAVMTRKESNLISDLQETFENLRRYKMMLNPLKCVFGVPVGKLLSFIVSHRGIEDSIYPKPQTEGIAEEYLDNWRHLWETCRQGRSSAPDIAFVLESPTPSSPRNSVRCGSFEFTPCSEASHPISTESRGSMDATFGGVHFIIDSRGFLRLLSSSAPSPRTLVPDDTTPTIALAVLPRNMREGSRSSFGSKEE
ncbi:hypothetical protein QYE76_067510 [Lolium multiflorum]|uniref:Reverse transcriptase domain-containing protein n=1 Tax=Lolium multiflorum TaxID=4521 RepID=A0AAD8SCS0_LOLMU|nr:hypothetical protein QYE76_067510 [Lolium multiflorum]